VVRGELSDWTIVTELEDGFASLWPLDGGAATFEALRAWQHRADGLCARAEAHVELRKQLLGAVDRTPLPEDSVAGIGRARNLSRHSRTVALLQESQQRLEARPRTEETSRWLAAIDEAFWAEEEGAAMNSSTDSSLGRFNASTLNGWRLLTHDRFIRALADFTPRSVPSTTEWPPVLRKRWVVDEALAFAERWARELAPASAAIWREAALDVAGDPRYGGLELSVQYGFVPLGRDPRTGLWEFWATRTGAEPERRRNGQFAVGPETGMIFVLLPGGSTRVGAQANEPGAGYFDPAANAGRTLPLHEVRLEPFLISKYEMTQAQWSRFSDDRSYFCTESEEGCPYAIRPDHPQEHMKPAEALDCLRILGLELPTEEQWEYAARGGTDTTFWFGERVEGIAGMEHVRVGSVDVWSPPFPEHDVDNEGFTVHAPVGLFAPNGFGLYDVSGNVSEWCRAGDGTGVGVAYRGGNWSLGANALADAAVARRTSFALERSTIGVRPIRRLSR